MSHQPNARGVWNEDHTSNPMVIQPSPMYPPNFLPTNIGSEPAPAPHIEPSSSEKKNTKGTHFVLPTPGSKIICKWENCGNLIDPTTQALENHMSKHRNVTLIMDKRLDFRLACRWVCGKKGLCNEELLEGSLLKHFGSHLHKEGQPSPFLRQSGCCKKIYVFRGSSSKHLRSCDFQKKSDSEMGPKCPLNDSNSCPHPEFCLLSILKGDSR